MEQGILAEEIAGVSFILYAVVAEDAYGTRIDEVLEDGRREASCLMRGFIGSRCQMSKKR